MNKYKSLLRFKKKCTKKIDENELSLIKVININTMIEFN